MATARALARISREALDRPLEHDLELLLEEPEDVAIVHGAFDRGAILRGSGGAPVRVGPGMLWVQLAIRRPIVDETRILNRYVRPLLAALTKLGPPARYFGRDWVSIDSRPSTEIAYAHDLETGRTLFEAFVPCTSAVSIGERASHGGKLSRMLGVEVERVKAALAHAYTLVPVPVPVPVPDSVPVPVPVPVFVPAPAWDLAIDDAMGKVCAGRDAEGVLRLGGEIMGSRQAVRAIEAGGTGWLFGTRLETAREVLRRAGLRSERDRDSG